MVKAVIFIIVPLDKKSEDRLPIFNRLADQLMSQFSLLKWNKVEDMYYLELECPFESFELVRAYALGYPESYIVPPVDVPIFRASKKDPDTHVTIEPAPDGVELDGVSTPCMAVEVNLQFPDINCPSFEEEGAEMDKRVDELKLRFPKITKWNRRTAGVFIEGPSEAIVEVEAYAKTNPSSLLCNRHLESLVQVTPVT